MIKSLRHVVTFESDGSYVIDEHPDEEICTFDESLEAMPTPNPGTGQWYNWVVPGGLSWERIEEEKP